MMSTQVLREITHTEAEDLTSLSRECLHDMSSFGERSARAPANCDKILVVMVFVRLAQ